ncbi:hypothetical protein M2263_003740 [Providencia alcalifaciens]|nr:hypothetical protein [Providencia alcalifaciens]
MVVLSAPLYFAMHSDVIEVILLAQLMMTIYAAMILCNSSWVLAQAANVEATTQV